MREENIVNGLRRTVLEHVARAFWEQGEAYGDTLNRIPYVMRPKHGSYSRCCIYRDRAILRLRCMAALGFRLEEEDDDATPLAAYGARALQRVSPTAPILTVCDIACHGCVPARFYITDACHSCVARACVGACRFGAITVMNGRSYIDAQKCRNCGKCQEACPYQAIVRLKVPCEEACPVKAIHKGDNGRAEIDTDTCISCGRCMRACPFGAVNERSELIDVLRALKAGKHATALLAPAIVGQFAGSLEQVTTALRALGFAAVMEVAHGADVTSHREAEEFAERMAQGQPFMTTSCCPGYVAAVARHVPDMAPYVSDTGTPMHYSAELARQEAPDTITVFIGPCVAKRFEALADPLVDYVLTFEELGAIFAAAHIRVEACEAAALEHIPSGAARGYAIAGGVAEAVRRAVDGKTEVRPVSVNGLSAAGLRQLRSFAKNPAACTGNLVEVMACEGGCVGGAGVLGDKNKTTKAVAALAADTQK